MRIEAFSETVDVFSLSSLPSDPSQYLDRRDSSAGCVIITPSRLGDGFASCFSERGNIPPEISAFCAGTFLYKVRGYPNEELEIETSDGIYRVVRDQKSGIISILLPKCKVLYTNKREMLNEAEVFTSAFSYKNYIFKLVECKNVIHFSDAVLRALSRLSLGDSIDGVAVYSVKDNEVVLKTLLASEKKRECKHYIILAALTAALPRLSSGRGTLCCEGSTLDVSFSQGELLLSDKELKTFKLSAPDIT